MLNKASIDLIKSFEGLKLTAYLCPANVPTIGYGTTKGLTRADVGRKTITEAEATRLLVEDVARFEKAVDELVKVKLTENQRGALVSWTYNLGEAKLAGSPLLGFINAKANTADIERSWLKWNKARVKGVLKPLAGLTRRRQAEIALWKKP
ncbi:lysozyme [Agrobacterium sp. DKPNP3]|uniref:lysozyme n=1 Tax=Agrobacterium sp. DKPNP3 TaxID=3457323 RepID=UPI00404487F6